MKKLKLAPVTTIILSFMGVILLGMVVFKLPISLKDGVNITWMDSFFLSTSAITTTGLTTFSDVSQTLSTFGKVMLGLFIQNQYFIISKVIIR